MTPASPTWADVERFLDADGWRQLPAKARGGRRQKHVFFEKLLPDNRLLQTHISHDRSASMGAGRFGAILREQLEVSREAFWEAIRTGNPVERPTPIEERPVEHPAWVVRVLIGELHLTADEIERLDPDEAERRVRAHWTETQPPGRRR